MQQNHMHVVMNIIFCKNAGISSTTTSSNSSLLILKVTISTTDDIFDRLSDWETDVTTVSCHQWYNITTDITIAQFMIVARAYSHLHWHIYCFKYTESDLCWGWFFGNETKVSPQQRVELHHFVTFHQCTFSKSFYFTYFKDVCTVNDNYICQ